MKQKIAFALMMGIVTTGIISFTLISINIGFNERFLQVWLRSWGMAYMVVIPAILIIGPQVQKMVDRLLGEAKQNDGLQKKSPEINPQNMNNDYEAIWNVDASWYHETFSDK